MLPDIAIPKITISVSAPNKTARVIENTITRPLRNQLIQVNNLEDLNSTSRNGSSYIEIILRQGTNTDLSFIETNEKVDQAMNLLPRDLNRPRVVKSNVSDIPVFYLNIVPKDENQTTDLERSDFAEKVIKRRLEQLDEIAFVDIHGQSFPQVTVAPKETILQSMGITIDVLMQAIRNNNIDIGNVQIKDGQYQYSVEIKNRLERIEDIMDLTLQIQGQIYSIKDLADVSLVPLPERGAYGYNDKKGIILSVRKKDIANNFDLKKSFDETIEDIRETYPLLNFNIINDQTTILEVSYKNLRTSLLYGILFSSLILFLFFREWRLPLLIIVTVPLSLLLSVWIFYLAGISINIISLSGLILGVGLMIDNAIIIIDNIREEEKIHTQDDAIVIGTLGVFRPLLSSAMTTCSVFLPLILISGIAGSLFYDQALSITIALSASLLVSTVVLPVLVKLVFRNQKKKTVQSSEGKNHHRLICLLYTSPSPRD